MIKVTVNHEGKEKDLFLWLTARENGKDKLVINVTINESEVLASERMHTHTERKWHHIIGVQDEYIIDSESVNDIIIGKWFRKLYHELFKTILDKNKAIINSTIIL